MSYPQKPDSGQAFFCLPFSFHIPCFTCPPQLKSAHSGRTFLETVMTNITHHLAARENHALLGDHIIRLLRDELGEKAPACFHAEVLGAVLTGLQKGDSLDNVVLKWSADHFIAHQLGPRLPDLWRLFDVVLAAQQSSVNAVADMNHADRYARVFLMSDLARTMAIQTQNYTYVVALVREQSLDEAASTAAGRIVWTDGYTLHLRLCTSSHGSRDGYRASLTAGDLDYLMNIASLKNHPSFRYGDLRDQGYLVTVAADLLQPWVAKDGLTNYATLVHVHHDLMSWLTTFKETQPALAAN